MAPALESILIALGVGLVLLALGLFIKKIPKHVVILFAAGIGIIVYILWPRTGLVDVPELSGLSRDNAVLELSNLKLVGVAEPQPSANTPIEHVIAGSQDVPPGTKVKPGAVVRFSVSILPTVPATSPAKHESTLGAAIFANGDEVVAKRGADNIFRFEVEGTVRDFDSTKSALLLWDQPIDPPSDQPGWYLQRSPTNGIVSISGTRWRGICQIGNAEFPPHDGDTVEVAVAVLHGEEAQRILGRQGPVTTISLPGVVSRIVRYKVRIR